MSTVGRPELPPPITKQDEYLHAIAVELRALNDVLRPPAAVHRDGDDSGRDPRGSETNVPLREPSPPARKRQRPRATRGDR